VGLGLNNEHGISLRGLDEAKQADLVFAELYTNLMPNLSVANLEKLIGKPVRILNRKDVEENAQQTILDSTRNKRAIFLVPGDPMAATTHIDLRLRAEKYGIITKIIAGVSIQTAAAALVGLQSVKFGRTITLPLPHCTPPESPYDYLRTNIEAGLHTLILLDLHTEQRQYMTIRDGIRYLSEIERIRRENVFPNNILSIGIARVGSDDMTLRGGTAHELGEMDFGSPPHCIVVPSKLHFMEVQALRHFTNLEMEEVNAL
jgi:diphthine synthase